HISEFYGMTSKVLGDLGGLALQFDRHGKELADVVNTIEKSNLNVASSVAERKQAIEGLVSIVDERTEELDGRLKRFTSLLYQALHAAEDRARDVARLLVDATAEGARAVAEQHAAIRSTTEQQSAQTLESLQIVFDQVSSESKKLFQKNSSEAHQLLQQATDRFTDVMQAMKQMSLDMQNELDKTRQEMRRGVLELPEEAAASTAQMRRVIVDQMEALAELNRIVARHGRAMDTVTTGSEPPTAKRAHRSFLRP
ncbi:MAG: negative regulator of septation ring formation, partial [Acidimicrobiales bacterium]